MGSGRGWGLGYTEGGDEGLGYTSGRDGDSSKLSVGKAAGVRGAWMGIVGRQSIFQQLTSPQIAQKGEIANHIRHCCDKGARGDGRISIKLFQHHRDENATQSARHQIGEHGERNHKTE